MRNEDWGRVDLHLHSHASNVTDYYAANHFSIPESYSEPLALYGMLKSRGMHFGHHYRPQLDQWREGTSGSRIAGRVHQCRNDHHLSGGRLQHSHHGGQHYRSTVCRSQRLRGNVYEMVAFCDQEIAREAEGTETAWRTS